MADDGEDELAPGAKLSWNAAANSCGVSNASSAPGCRGRSVTGRDAAGGGGDAGGSCFCCFCCLPGVAGAGDDDADAADCRLDRCCGGREVTARPNAAALSASSAPSISSGSPAAAAAAEAPMSIGDESSNAFA